MPDQTQHSAATAKPTERQVTSVPTYQSSRPPSSSSRYAPRQTLVVVPTSQLKELGARKPDAPRAGDCNRGRVRRAASVASPASPGGAARLAAGPAPQTLGFVAAAVPLCRRVCAAGHQRLPHHVVARPSCASGGCALATAVGRWPSWRRVGGRSPAVTSPRRRGHAALRPAAWPSLWRLFVAAVMAVRRQLSASGHQRLPRQCGRAAFHLEG